MARTGDVQANVRLSAAQVNRVQSGQQAVISPIAQPDREFRGKVEKISGTLDDRSQDQRSRHVTVVLSDEQQEAIRSLTPGLMAVVEVQAPMTGVLRVPTDAVVQENAESFCYVRTPQGVRKQKVVPGLGNDEVIEVKDGLNEGDLVVRNPWTVGGPEAGGE